MAEKMVELGYVEEISYGTVRRVLKKKTELKPHLKQYWKLPPRENANFVVRMEHVLDLYQQEANPECPLICLDEKPMQVIGSLREEVPMKPGKPRRVDYEYGRHGTQNLFMFFAPLLGWRHVEVRERRRKVDFAEAVQAVIDDYFPDAEGICLVCDNLNTHHAGSFYERYGPKTACKLARKVKFHYTPKNGSWLNMAEIELAALEAERSERGIDVDWRFTTEDARLKLKRLYPHIDD